MNEYKLAIGKLANHYYADTLQRLAKKKNKSQQPTLVPTKCPTTFARELTHKIETEIMCFTAKQATVTKSSSSISGATLFAIDEDTP